MSEMAIQPQCGGRLEYAGNFHFYGLLPNGRQHVGNAPAAVVLCKASVLRESDGMGAVKLHAEYEEYDYQDPSS
jgi:hypothetical protein